MAEDANIQLLNEGEKVTRIQQDDGIDEIRQKRLAYFESIHKQQNIYEDHGKSSVKEFDQNCGENVKQLNKPSPGKSPDTCQTLKEEPLFEKGQLGADANENLMMKRKLIDHEYMERNVTLINGHEIMNGTSKQSEKDARVHSNQHMPSAFNEYDTDKYQHQAALKTGENFERNFGKLKQHDTFFAVEKPLVSDSPRGIQSGWSASYVEHVKSKQFENIDELFLKRDRQEKILSPKTRLKESVTESQEVEAIPLFQKSVDLSELGLCTHRPESDRYTDEKRVDNPAHLLDDVMSEELRNALGEEKYREFLVKSMKDLSELQKERNSDRSSARKDKSQTLHKGEKTADKEKVTGKSSVQLQTSPARKLEYRETAKMNQQSKPDLSKSKSLQTKEKFEKKEVSHPLKERDNEDGNGDTLQGSLSKDSPRPKLNRPKFSPPSIWQNSMEWSHSGSDGRKDGGVTPVTPTQTGYLRNYEQITVPRNVSFSSDEIYQQAYGMNVHSGLYGGAGIPISPHSPHPYISNPFFHPGGVPFSPMGPSNVYMNPMVPTATNTVMSPQFMFNQYSMNVSHSMRESADKGYFPIMNAFNGDSSSPVPVPRPPNKSYPGEKLTSNEKHQGDANGMFFTTHPQTPRSEQLNGFQGQQMFPYPVMVPVLIPHPPVQPQTGAKDLARIQPVQSQTSAKDAAHIQPMQPQTGAKDSTHIHSAQTQTNTKDSAHIQSVQSFGARKELVSEVESSKHQQNGPPSLLAEDKVNQYVQEQSEEDSSSDGMEEEDIIPHPPKGKKLLKTRSPRWTKKTEDQVKWNSDSKRHIEGIRQHHEQRRQQQVEEKLTEEQILEKQRKFANASLKRYFKSLESMYKPGKRHFSPPSPHSVASNTDDENDGRDEAYPEIVFRLDENGDNDASDNEVRIAGDNKDDVDASDNEIGIVGESKNADDADNVAIETGAGSDDGGMTLVQSAVTGTSIKAGGITERLNKLGIDTSLIKHDDNGVKDQTGQTSVNSDKKSVKKPKLVILCPECEGINKSYMTWCCHCGENIMGIDPVLVRKNRKGVIKIMPAILNGTSNRNSQYSTDEVVKTQKEKDQNIKSKLDNQRIGMVHYSKSDEFFAEPRSIKPKSDIEDNNEFHPGHTHSQEKETKQNGPDFSMQKIAGKTRALIEKFQNVSDSAAEDMDTSRVKLNSQGKVTLLKHSKDVDATPVIHSFEDSDLAKCQQNVTSWAFHIKPSRSHSEHGDVKDSTENGPVGHSSTSLSYNKDKIMSSIVDSDVKEHHDGDVSPIDISLDDTSCFLPRQNALKSMHSSQDVANPSLENSDAAVPLPIKTVAKIPMIRDQTQQGNIDYSNPSSKESRPFLSRTNQPDDFVNIMMSKHDLHVSPVKSDGRDSGQPSSEDRSPPHNFQRTEKEINEICEHISDPVIRGFIKSYFTRKKQAIEAQGVSTTTGPELMKSNIQSHEAMEKAIPVIPEAIAGAFANELKGLPNELALELQHSFDFSQASSVDLTQVLSMPNEQWATQNVGKKEGHKKAHKKRHAGAIDVEVFGYEESRQSRNSSRGLKLVPLLNLKGSSDDESMSEHSAAPYQPPARPEEDQDDGEWETLFEPAIKENEPGNIETIEEVQEEVLDEVEVSDEPFLAQIISNSPGKKKKQGKKEARGQGRGSPIKSKVRQSVEAPGYQRKWARSSIAWSSFNSGELSTKSTLRASTENLERSSSDPKVKATGENASGRHSDRASSSPRPPPKQKSRPLSADLKKRKQQRYHPVSARRQDSVEVMEDKGPADVLEHRLPQSELWEKIYAKEEVKKDEMMASPKSTYSKYLQMTPRIQEGSVSVWQCLPDEILLHILAYLSQADLVRCAQVCHQFYRVAMDETLWKHITIKKKLLDDDCLRHIAKHHPTSLALIQCQGDTVSAKGLCDLFRESANDLKELNFSYCSRGALTGDSILVHAAARCQNLTHIDASWSNVTDSGIIAISNGCKRLESTCINGCQAISNEGFETMIKKHGGSLRVLEMFGCFGITARAINTLSNNCTNLVSLHLGQCYKLTDSCISQLSASLGRVETLDLRGCKQIKDNCIRRVVKNCPRLKSLVLANCPNITDVSVLEISTYLTDIRSIDVCGCKNITDNSVRALANSCMNLRHVDISSSGCTHRSVSLIASFCGQRLECLKLNFLSDVTEACIIKLIKNCKRLKMLHLYGCTNIRNLDKIRDDNPGMTIES